MSNSLFPPDPPAIVAPAEAYLKQLFARINERERRSDEAAVQHAADQGNDLLRGKGKAGQGNWERAVRDNCTLSLRQVRRYTLFAEWLKSAVTADLAERVARWREINDNAAPAQEEAPPEAPAEEEGQPDPP